MACRFMSGNPQFYNLLARAVTQNSTSNLTLTSPPSSSFAALFPSSSLYDGLSGLTYQSDAGNQFIDTDLNVIGAGNMDGTWVSPGGGAAVLPLGFGSTLGIGSPAPSITQSNAVAAHSGSFSAKLTAGTTASGLRTATLYKQITARPGEKIHVDFWSYGNGVVPTFRLLNTITGAEYNLSTQQWVSAVTPPTANNLSSLSSWQNTAFDVTLESFATCRYNDTIPLKLMWTTPNTSGATFYLDDVCAWPWHDCVALIGGNFIQYQTQAQGADNAGFSSATTYGDLTMAGPNMMLAHASSGLRYVRVFTNGVVGNVAIGELIIGQSQTLSFGLQHPGQQAWEISYKQPQIRNTTPAGMSFINNLSSQPLRTMKIPMQAASEAERTQILYDLYARSGFGRYPSLVIPEDTESTIIFGRLAGEAQINRVMSGVGNYYESELAIEEMELPTLVS